MTKTRGLMFLREAPERFRADAVREVPNGVDRSAGDEKAGLIRGASVIVRGEAAGHGAWIDGHMLESVSEAINAAGPNGIKARFTHPGMSSDGLGTYLGRWKNASVDGDAVVADLHLAQSARKTPDGDLAEYVLKLAEDDPDMFGISIVFERDIDEERKFRTSNSDPKEGFRSPDPKNEKHYGHVRLKKLRAGDAVDTPAANPRGLFYSDGSEVPAIASDFMAYAMGLSESVPEADIGIDPDRARQFVDRYLKLNGLRIVDSHAGVMAEQPGTKSMDPNTPANSSQAPETPLCQASEGTHGSQQSAPTEAPEQKVTREQALAALSQEERDLLTKSKQDKEREAMRAEFRAILEEEGYTRKTTQAGERPAATNGAGSAPTEPAPEKIPTYRERYDSEVGNIRGDRGALAIKISRFHQRWGRTEAEYLAKLDSEKSA